MAETNICDWQLRELLERARQVIRRSQELTLRTDELIQQSRKLRRDFSLYASDEGGGKSRHTLE